jgi:hypothetical protein
MYDMAPDLLPISAKMKWLAVVMGRKEKRRRLSMVISLVNHCLLFWVWRYFYSKF